jgi:hypothetical protein
MRLNPGAGLAVEEPLEMVLREWVVWAFAKQSGESRERAGVPRLELREGLAIGDREGARPFVFRKRLEGAEALAPALSKRSPTGRPKNPSARSAAAEKRLMQLTYGAAPVA